MTDETMQTLLDTYADLIRDSCRVAIEQFHKAGQELAVFSDYELAMIAQQRRDLNYEGLKYCKELAQTPLEEIDVTAEFDKATKIIGGKRAVETSKSTKDKN